MIDITITPLQQSGRAVELRFINERDGLFKTVGDPSPKIVARERLESGVWKEIVFDLNGLSGMHPDSVRAALEMILK